MPVGMTLQQLYSQPTYHGDASAAMASSAPIVTSIAVSSVSAKRVPSPVQPAMPPQDKEYSPRTHDAAYARASYPEHMQPPHYPAPYGQMPPPHAYSQYPPKAPHGSEEYGLADPLPFEYMGMRKFPDANKDQDRYISMGAQYPPSYNAHSPHPSVYETQHAHPPKSVEERAYHQYPHHGGDRPYHPDSQGHFPHAPHPSMPPHLYAANHSMAPHHSFPPLIDTQNVKKDPASEPQQYSPHRPVEYTSAPTSAQGASQEAVIKVKTPLKTKYWRNGRRNLQCFPSCKVFGDYSSIKIEDLKQHDFMWGKCRGSLITEVTLNSSVSFDDILILGRVHSLENVPVAFEEAVIRECMLGRMVEPEVMDSMKDQWITGERLPDFVQQEGNTACYEFKPKVWKYTEDMTQGKCKRRNVKYYVQFEAFVLVMSGERRYYACIGSGMSTAFEVGSSRVLARQKRKAATGLDANPLYMKPSQNAGSPTDMGANSMPHPMMAPHPMMPPQGMHSQMYPQSYPPQAYASQRGLAPAVPHPAMMSQMHHGDNASSMHYHQPPQPIPIQPQAPSASTGQKRKASPSPSNDRAPKAKKTAKESTAL